jgi:hypothetical protein
MGKIEFFKSRPQRIKSGILYSFLLLIFSYLTVFEIKENHFINSMLFLIFILVSTISLIKIILNQPTVLINSEGIRNNTNNTGLIEWRYIKDFEIKTVMNRKILVINLSYQDTFLANKNPIARMLMKTNIKKLGSPTAIGEFEFNEPLENVIEKINSFVSKKPTLK